MKYYIAFKTEIEPQHTIFIRSRLTIIKMTENAFPRCRGVLNCGGEGVRAVITLSELAKKLGRETSFTAAQVAAGMTALGRMGFNPKEIENAIQPMMNLSRATGTDLATAAEIAANALRAMGMDTSRTEEVVDILTARLPVLSDIAAARDFLDDNGDGSVTIVDVTELVNIILGKD